MPLALGPTKSGADARIDVPGRVLNHPSIYGSAEFPGGPEHLTEERDGSASSSSTSSIGESSEEFFFTGVDMRTRCRVSINVGFLAVSVLRRKFCRGTDYKKGVSLWHSATKRFRGTKFLCLYQFHAVFMDPTICEVTVDEFKVFYTRDRHLYTILVQDLCRNPLECMHIMGFWHWLEQACICSIIPTILSLRLSVINQLAEEALCCLQIVGNKSYQILETADEIPLTRILLPCKISLQYLREIRQEVYNDVQTALCSLYIPLLSDIMEMARHGGSGDTSSAQSLISDAASAAFSETALLSSHEPPDSINSQPEVPIPDSAKAMAQMSMDPLFQSFSYVKGDAPSCHTSIVKCSRTMFATFSKGYPVTEDEVKEYFTTQFGDCIESLHMQEVKPPDKQALYARIVFSTPSIIHAILNGRDTAKFTIKGKHVWVRKFVPRAPAPISRPGLPAPSNRLLR